MPSAAIVIIINFMKVATQAADRRDPARSALEFLRPASERREVIRMRSHVPLCPKEGRKEGRKEGGDAPAALLTSLEVTDGRADADGRVDGRTRTDVAPRRGRDVLNIIF